MAEVSLVKELKIIVGPDDKLQITQTLKPDTELGTDIKINLDDLKRETIKTLVNMLRENRLTTDKEFEVLGANLYSILFSNQIGEVLRDVLISDETLDYLRIELEFSDGQTELASWPWEYLYCPVRLGEGGTGYPLGRLENVVLTRHLRLGGITGRSLQVEERPVRVLFVAASPEDPDDKELKPVQYGSVLRAINELPPVKQGLIKVTTLVDDEFVPTDGQTRPTGTPSKTTFPNFIEMVDQIRPHIIHFIGHGKCTQGCGQVIFTRENYTSDPVKDSEMAISLLPYKELRLVFLQACESALPDPYQAVSGVAMHLAQKNIPAVVAMQYRVQLQIANLFAKAFYHALADNKTVDVAVKEARKKIYLQLRDIGMAQAYGLPVLYLRRSGALFARDISNGQGGGEKGLSPSGIMQQQAAQVASDQRVVDLIVCPRCNAQNKSSAKHCGHCGAALGSTPLIVCPACGTPVESSNSYCNECGTSLYKEKQGTTGSLRNTDPATAIGPSHEPVTVLHSQLVGERGGAALDKRKQNTSTVGNIGLSEEQVAALKKLMGG